MSACYAGHDSMVVKCWWCAADLTAEWKGESAELEQANNVTHALFIEACDQRDHLREVNAELVEALRAEQLRDEAECSEGCRCHDARSFAQSESECRACDLGIEARALREAVLAKAGGK